MARDMSELPIDESGNGERLRTITIDVADAAILYHAALIGANTVMMGGRGKAENRMHYYKSQFLSFCPPGHAHFDREEDISNIAIAMMDADKCTFQRIKAYSSDTKARSKITVGDQCYTVWNKTLDEVDQIIECLKAICPLTCEIEILEDVIERGW